MPPPVRKAKVRQARQAAVWFHFCVIFTISLGWVSYFWYFEEQLAAEYNVQLQEKDGPVAFCGDGNVGIGLCEDTGQCCNAWGHCGWGQDFCALERGCLSGPGCPANFGGQNYTMMEVNWCGGGSIGNGLCQDTNMCCNKWGQCGQGRNYCRKDAGCISGPGCDSVFTPTLVDALGEQGLNSKEIEAELVDIRSALMDVSALLDEIKPECPPCGDGMVGTGRCADPSKCCNRFGMCGTGAAFCAADSGCLSGPGCPFGGLPARVCLPSIPQDYQGAGIILVAAAPQEDNINLDPLSVSCGDGFVGSGFCADPELCCRFNGYCEDSCQAQPCFTGPDCKDPVQSAISKSGPCNLVALQQWEDAFTLNGFERPPASGKVMEDLLDLCATEGGMTSKRELAMFVAQIMMETQFFYTHEMKCAQDPAACVTDYGGVLDITGEQYYGRGYIQLTWAENYAQFSQAYYGDLRAYYDPEIVAVNVPLQSALWYWKTRVHNGAIIAGEFGAATLAINGGLECGANVDAAFAAKARQRFDYYTVIYKAWNLQKVDGPPQGAGCYELPVLPEVAVIPQGNLRFRA